jgi:hypothetical protein
MYVADKDFSNARKAYEEDVDIMRALSARDPGDTLWKNDLAVSLNEVGGVLVSQNDLPGAIKVYRESLEIRRALAMKDPTNADWQYAVGVCLWKLAKIPDSGVTWQQVVDQMELMAARGQLQPADRPRLEWARQQARKTP